MEKEKEEKGSVNATASIRRKFLDYFENQGHRRVASSSLIPGNDPTILFTNAGMNQFKDVFLGLEKRDYTRATTSQKCLRAGGKHNDLENVGFTARHHTFFEMLGNFSFGDYFKREAIDYAWTFVTKNLAMPKDRLYVTVHVDDDESADIWHKDQGVPKDRIFRFDKDNFWQMADTGPCGPCSEIFFDRQPEKGIVTSQVMEDDGDRVMEFWNLVFMQFNQQEDGSRDNLPKPSVDTGMGLERLASMLQEVDTNYDIDLFQHIIRGIERESKVETTPENVVGFRVIADHLRACSFLITDGVIPSNEGRGYVLRRILRRAIRFGRTLGQSQPFIHQVVPDLVDVMGDAYKELKDSAADIGKIIRIEEERFHETLESGIERLEAEFKRMSQRGEKVLNGELAFKLYDTFGFPLDLTQLICREKKIDVDTDGFEKFMGQQRETSRASGKKGLASTNALQEATLKEESLLQAPQEFVGYDCEEVNTSITFLFRQTEGSLESVETLQGADSGIVFTKDTSFYAEGGGQVGDQGELEYGSSSRQIVDTQKADATHHGHFVTAGGGDLKVGDTVVLKVDGSKREATKANHSATHLLHSALRDVLGTHVKQSGSKVDENGLRFDFSHFQATTKEELARVQGTATSWAQKSFDVKPVELSYQEAIDNGAMALFDEKYGDRVRTIKMGDVSFELCGGTHVSNTKSCDPIVITGESSVAAGVRRIEAKAGVSAQKYLQGLSQELADIAKNFGCEPKELPATIQRLRTRLKELETELQESQKGGEDTVFEELKSKAEKQGNANILIESVTAVAPKAWRDLCDRLRSSLSPVVIVLFGAHDGRAHILAAATPKAAELKGVHCGNLIKELATMVDGRGGGRPDMAQAGGSLIEGLDKVKDRARELINSQL